MLSTAQVLCSSLYLDARQKVHSSTMTYALYVISLLGNVISKVFQFFIFVCIADIDSIESRVIELITDYVFSYLITVRKIALHFEIKNCHIFKPIKMTLKILIFTSPLDLCLISDTGLILIFTLF